MASEQELAIRGVIGDLAWLADRGDLAEYTTLWTEDATWEMGDTVFHGRDAIVDAARGRRDRSETGPGTGTLHFVSVLSVRVDDAAGSAQARSSWVFHVATPDGPTTPTAGHYEDSLERGVAGWQVRHRRVFVTW